MGVLLLLVQGRTTTLPLRASFLLLLRHWVAGKTHGRPDRLATPAAPRLLSRPWRPGRNMGVASAASSFLFWCC